MVWMDRLRNQPSVDHHMTSNKHSISNNPQIGALASELRASFSTHRAAIAAHAMQSIRYLPVQGRLCVWHDGVWVSANYFDLAIVAADVLSVLELECVRADSAHGIWLFKNLPIGHAVDACISFILALPELRLPLDSELDSPDDPVVWNTCMASMAADPSSVAV